ncbi:hypothetical protein I317_05042 [Kwoniella heveanensis CBS 569]|nr:hypothetical protein I317_05042 [Kwoniella heveanensis CBS 569]
MSCILENNNGTTTAIPCNDVNGSANLFTGEVAYSSYGYEPNHAATYAFLGLYAAGFLAQVLLGIWHRCWWTLPTLAAGSLKWDRNNGGVWEIAFGSFIMQICCLVIGPTFFSAANYILLGRLISATGGTYSSLHPQSFSILFIAADVVCLVVQAVGGGWAGTADTHEGSDNGAKVMTAGVVLQLVITVIYVGLLTEFIWRKRNNRAARKQVNPFGRFFRRKHASQDQDSGAVDYSNNSTIEALPLSSRNGSWDAANLKPEDDGLAGSSSSRAQTQAHAEAVSRAQTPSLMDDKKVNLMCWLVSGGTLLIVIRSVYRSIELSDGWEGPIATNEPLFFGMDALLMALFIYLYAVIHPGLAFGRRLF